MGLALSTPNAPGLLPARPAWRELQIHVRVSVAAKAGYFERGAVLSATNVFDSGRLLSPVCGYVSRHNSVPACGTGRGCEYGWMDG